MKLIHLLFILSLCPNFIMAQRSEGVSSNGHYVFAFVDKTMDNSATYLVVQSTKSGWKKEIHVQGKEGAAFSPDNKALLYKSRDTLIIQWLDTDKREVISKVSSFNVPLRGAYFIYSSGNRTVVRNYVDGSEKVFEDIMSYDWQPKNEAIVFTSNRIVGNDKTVSMVWLDLLSMHEREIWSARSVEIKSKAFNTNGDRLAFIVNHEQAGHKSSKIWSFHSKDRRATMLLDDNSAGMDTSLCVSDWSLQFVNNCDQLLFYFIERSLPKKNPKYGNVDIWSYTDMVFQNYQNRDIDQGIGLRKFIAVANAASGKFIRLEYPKEKLIGEYFNPWFSNSKEENRVYVSGSNAIICVFPDDIVNNLSVVNDYQWNKNISADMYLLSLVDGKRTLLKENYHFYSKSFPYVKISPTGKFVLFYDAHKKGYDIYNIALQTWTTVAVSRDAVWNFGDDGSFLTIPFNPRGIFGWFPQDTSVMISDRYSDVWKVSTSKYAKPVNLTKGYFKKNKLSVERLTKNSIESINYVYYGGPICLSGVPRKENERYQNTGYYIFNPSWSEEPKPLIPVGGNIRYDVVAGSESASQEDLMYLLMGQSATIPPQYYRTDNFTDKVIITSSQLEQRRPQRKELLTWKGFDGTICRGVLVYPNDFDPSKKYPVIVSYYQLISNTASVFATMANPKSYQGEGYFSFVPDVYNAKATATGNMGRTAYNSIVSGAKYLATFPFINAKKMGITGTSFGGFQTHYIYTHTKIFAAAIAACGMGGDMFSAYFEDQLASGSIIEMQQIRIGVTPWERPDVYLRNSPVFYADRVTTPVLMGHGTNDYTVPFSQSVAMFKALRRLGKPAWLLSETFGDPLYSQHSTPAIINGVNLHRQFFNHYLKDAPAPKWMLDGVAARMKGVEDVTVLDSTGRKPGPGIKLKKELRAPSSVKLINKATMIDDDGRVVDVKASKPGIKKGR